MGVFRHSIGCNCCGGSPVACQFCVTYQGCDGIVSGLPYTVKLVPDDGEIYASGVTDENGKACWLSNPSLSDVYYKIETADDGYIASSQSFTQCGDHEVFLSVKDGFWCCEDGLSVPKAGLLLSDPEPSIFYNIVSLNPIVRECCQDTVESIGATWEDLGSGFSQWVFSCDDCECGSISYLMRCDGGTLTLGVTTNRNGPCGGCPDDSVNSGGGFFEPTSITAFPFSATFDIPTTTGPCQGYPDQIYTIPGRTITVWDGSGSMMAPAPTLLQKAATFTRAAVRHAAAGFPTVPPEVQAARLAICETCPAYRPDDGTCGRCGCKLRKKSAWALEHCPLGKWPGDG